ncbi:TPA: DUF2817 domain-containing protein [Candidatus Saccharibacteria bacterium]|nr:DUF2817 domain-containing protein [Candidatus Saccharibacteria bacterium]HIO87992.1 DUF2817 domain-containing protein [Candidatus Saccharibacteria bacterium]
MRQKIKDAYFWAADLPMLVYVVFAAVCAVSIYLVIFLPAKTIDFSYAGGNCIEKFTLFPTIHETVDDDYFEVTHGEYKQLGSIPIFSSETCVSPKQAPKPGTSTVASAPWGGFFAQKNFAVEVPGLPQANLSVFKKPIPTKKTIKIPLSQTDNLHEYEIVVDDKATECTPTSSAVVCDVSTLSLDQGAEYDYKLLRGFSGQKVRVSEGELETLPAIAVIGSSVSEGQIIYDKPANFTVETDKELHAAEAYLMQVDGDEETAVKGSLTYKDTKAIITPSEELTRNSDYIIRLVEAESLDGSSLAEPYQVRFTLSGGPAVASVSASTIKVGSNETIILTFDQELSDDVALSDLISFSGGTATINKKNATQATVKLRSLPKCQQFTITVKPGIVSKYGIAATEDWSFTGRTTCHSVSTIGSTRQGRSILSYSFGNSGPVTMFVGGLHGNESSSRKILDLWVNELEANPSRYSGKRVVIVPNVNADGLAAGTRNNSANVDLNRNFPTADWQADTESKNGILKGAGGTEPLSEPAAQALASYVEKMNPRLLLSFHAVGGVVIGDVGNISETYAATYAKLAGYRNTTGQSSQSTFNYNVTGSFEEWTVDNKGIPSMIVELTSYSSANFAGHKSALWAMLD